jgi:hypothetical protein
LAGLASGLAEAVSANMLEGIANSGMTGAEAVAARTFARVVGSAIRTAASPGDPGQAFASAFLDDVFKQIDTGTPVTQTAFDDEGRLNLGIVDPNATPDEQAQQLAAQLQRQGIPAAQANLMAQQAQQALGNVVDGVAQLPQTAQPSVAALAPMPPEVVELNLPADPLIVQGRLVPNAEHDRLIAELNAEFDIDADAPPPQLDDGPGQFERDPDFMPVGWVNDVGTSAAAYAQRLASRVGGELGDLFQRAVRVAGTALSYGDIAPLETVKLDIRDYLDARSAAGGLSEAEIILFGVLYAANETLFPTNAVDFAGGIGKGIKAAGALVVAGRGADVLATTTRAISAEQAVARQVQAVVQAVDGALPNAGKAVIDPNKLTSYALNPQHSVGGDKARVFESALGYNQSNADQLVGKIQQGALTNPAVMGKADQFGQRFTVDMPITGPNGNTAVVRTGWILDPGATVPRLVTAYVK